ncbi:LytTR family DNA-binding domain-containing protein [Mucilaginibacter sp.]|uniref:LytR/AlgR family response regulator transcription factor n=1 Tax=Mucilaginibacter sp. TaxID=1882438 RepID=UPI00263942F7|nr:LytTR family DNA-binding domain-containing protein [Mucilaginibacter sp.]MDB4924812.1 DNA-binding response regulator [Mucilaginibacter sp.]
MNCLIVDDEPLALDLMEDNIKQIPFLKLVGACRNAFEAMNVLNEQSVDLIFLDIQMPGISGLDFLRSLKNQPLAILVTAYEEHAVDSFDLDVVDYLLKPVSFPRFLKAVQRAHNMFKMMEQVNKASLKTDDHVFVNANYSLVKVMLDEVAFIEGLKDYVRINMISGKIIITRMGLKNIEEKLNPIKFMRIHKSYIIALDKIDSIQKAQLIIKDREIPIGDGYRQLLQSYISNRNL